MLMILLSTVSVSRHLIFYFWQELDLASGFESDQQGIIDCSRWWLVNFGGGETQINVF